MHDITQFRGLVHYKKCKKKMKKKKKNDWLGLWLQNRLIIYLVNSIF